MHVMMLASGDLWAGAEAVVYELARGLRLFTDTRVSAVYLNRGRLSELTQAAGIETHVIEESRHGFASIVAQVAKLTRKLGPHIIHAHRYKENILAALAAPAAGFPKLVTTQHGISELNDTWKLNAVLSLNTFILKACFSRVVAVSRDIENHLATRGGIPRERVGQVYNGIDTDRMAFAPAENRTGFTIGSAGRLVKVKDFLFMVDIAREVCARGKDVTFLLAGDGPEQGEIERRVKAYGLEDRFKLLGHVHDIGGFFSSLDVYLNTSKHEGIPMTILEAMARGIPVVAPDVGGMGEVIDGPAQGSLVPGRDAGAFARALLELAGSPEKRNGMRATARQRVEERFSTRAMASAYHELYREVFCGRG